MSATDLRKAAKALRDIVAGLDPWDGESAEDAGYETWADRYGVVTSAPAPDRAEQGFISTMHPGVGLALADWLEATADSQGPNFSNHPALSVARLINGT